MTLGVLVQARTARVARGITVDTGTLFIAGPTATGPLTAEIRSIGDFVTAFGIRAAGNQVLYDYVDTFFAEGGKHCYVSSIQGAVTVDVALARFSPDWGPGQVTCVPQVPATDWTKIGTAALAADRVGLLDVATGTDTVAVMTTAAGVGRALATNDRLAAFAPWVNVPPPAGVSGATARQVPGSAVVAGMCARVDNGGNPNRAAAGFDFPMQYATSLTQDVIKTDRDTLFAAGLNTLANRFGVLVNYGFDSPRVKDDYDPFTQFSAARGRMYIVGQAKMLAEPFVFRPIDALGHVQAQLKGSLEGMLLGLYEVDGLYGETPADAFQVSVGAAVNTPATTLAGELHAVCEVRFSKYAQAVIIDLVTVPLSGSVSQ
jgi:hypothetical protein